MVSKYLVPGMGGVIIALGLSVGYQSWSKARVVHTLAETRSSLKTALSASQTQLETIAVLKQANEQCFDEIKTSEEAQSVALAQLRAEKQQILAESRNRKERVKIIREDPDCDQLLNLDVDQVCPALAQDLRRR